MLVKTVVRPDQDGSRIAVICASCCLQATRITPTSVRRDPLQPRRWPQSPSGGPGSHSAILALRAQPPGLHDRLDPLGDDFHAEGASQRQDAVHHGGLIRPHGDVGDEAAVHLEPGDRKVPQHAERSKAGTEIVECDPDAQCSQRGQRFHHGACIPDRDVLGQFEFDPVGRHAVPLQRLRHLFGEGGRTELRGKEIYADA